MVDVLDFNRKPRPKKKEEAHVMVTDYDEETGAINTHCPICGREFHHPPNGDFIQVREGNKDAIHRACIGSCPITFG